MEAITVPLRLGEADARTLLLVRAVEETDQDGVLLPPRARAAATRRAFDDPRSADEASRLLARAHLLREDLLRAVPAVKRVLSPPRWHRVLALAIMAVAAIGGAATNVLGPERHVSVLAFPLAGILAWNLAVYAGLGVRALSRALARGRTGPARSRLAFAARWLEGAWLAGLARHLGRTTRSVAATEAVHRFQRLWLRAAAPSIAARVRAVLHLGALATAVGAVAGMYVSGIAFEYRATWESTWLDTGAVQRYLDTALAPAARVLDLPVPDVAPLRGPAGEGNAAPWIHLWGATLGLFVVVPRAALALVGGLYAARLLRQLPVDVDPGYARRALHEGRGAATAVDVVYYSCLPDSRLRERVHMILQERAGARAVIRDAGSLEYGDPPERVALPESAAGSGLVALVFPLAQTPEADVHGEFIEGLRDRLERAGWPLLVVLETATYRRRVGSGDRVRERRATWDRLLRDLQVSVIDVA